MKQQLKRVAALGLSLALALSVGLTPALAAAAPPPMPEGMEMPPDGMPGGPGGGPGGPGGPGGGTGAPSVEYQTLDVLGKAAGIFIHNGTVDQNADLIADAGTISATEISGTRITGTNIGPWNKAADETGVAGTSGIVIKNTGASEDVVVIGGPEDVFDVNGTGYNTVIILDNQDGDQPNTLYTDTEWTIDNGDNANCTFPGVGIAVSAKGLKIQNAYVETKGYHRPALATYDSATDGTAELAAEVIVEDSVLAAWGSEGAGSSAPTFTCMYGSARPVIINASADSYFFNSKILSSDWGSYSLDQCKDVNVNIVNSFNEDTVGGYGVYAIGATNKINMYGTTSVSGQYGAIICAGGSCDMFNLGKALENQELMSRYDGTLTLDSALNEGGTNRMIGANNAVTFTADISGENVISRLTAEDTYFSTLEKDAVADDGSAISSVLGTYDWLTNFSFITGGAPYFFLNYIDGAALCYRSVNSVLELDNCQLESKNGVAIQTVLGYDTSAMNIDIPDGTVYPGYDFTLSNMAVTGDILHEDYQRPMSLTLDHASLTGDIVTGTMTAWNSGIEAYVTRLWNSDDPAVGGNVGEAALAAGCTLENVIDTLEKNETYESFHGANLTVTDGSSWTVTGTSSLASLTLEEGASVQAPEGEKLAIYVDVEMSNANETFDVTTGTRLDALTAGTYSNVVLVAEGGAGDAVAACIAAGIIPEAQGELVTRAEAAVMLVNAERLTVSADAAPVFQDCAGHPAAASIAAAAQSGLMKGVSAHIFDPDSVLTRAQLAALICQVKELSYDPNQQTPAMPFCDVPAGAWYAGAVSLACGNGYLPVDGANYRPDAPATLAEFAAVLQMMYLGLV